MKRLFMFGLCFAAGIGAACAQRLVVDKVVANVGNSAILYSEVEEAMGDVREQYREMGYTSPRDPFYEALEILMERKLAYNQAQIDSLTIDESAAVHDADAKLKAQIAAAGSVHELERVHNMTIYDIRKTLEQAARENSFMGTVKWNVMHKVKVTPGEVELFFKTFPADSIPVIPEQYMYAHITRFPANMAQAKQSVRERLMEIREQVMSDKTKFETQARLYSEDAGADGTARKGGELPLLEFEQMALEWQPAVERLRPGQISEVIETEYGFQIIQLIETVGSKYRLRYIIMRPKYVASDLSEGTRLLDSVANVVREGGMTFEAAARKYSHDAQSRQNGGVATNIEFLQLTERRAAGAQAQYKFKKDDFTQYYNVSDYRAISRLKPGEISDAFATYDLKRNEMSKIVKLLAVYPAHEANMADDYLLLEQAALEDKMQREYKKWLERTIAGTYIYIDPAYRDAGKYANKNWVK